MRGGLDINGRRGEVEKERGVEVRLFAIAYIVIYFAICFFMQYIDKMDFCRLTES